MCWEKFLQDFISNKDGPNICKQDTHENMYENYSLQDDHGKGRQEDYPASDATGVG